MNREIERTWNEDGIRFRVKWTCLLIGSDLNILWPKDFSYLPFRYSLVYFFFVKWKYVFIVPANERWPFSGKTTLPEHATVQFSILFLLTQNWKSLYLIFNPFISLSLSRSISIDQPLSLQYPTNPTMPYYAYQSVHKCSIRKKNKHDCHCSGVCLSLFWSWFNTYQDCSWFEN